MPATLEQFAQVNDAAGATASKLRKQAILADYFKSLEPEDLPLAVRYAGGWVFSATSERTLNVGGAAVWDVTLDMLGIDPRAWHDLIVRHGEIGEAIAQIWESARAKIQPAACAERLEFSSPAAALSVGVDAPPLLLVEMDRAFDAIAGTGVGERKRALLRELLSRCRGGREAAYLTKIIFGDLRTGVQEGVLAAAIAEAFAAPLADVRRAQLLVGDLEDVALLARAGELASAKFRLFHPIQFMLATPKETALDAAQAIAGHRFWIEDKLDGIRAQVHKSGDRIAIYTRTMDRTDESFPDVAADLAKLGGDFLLDGEIVPRRDGVVLPFAHIQKRLGRKVITPAVLRENPAAFIAFDLLYLDGQLLLDEPLAVRREKLHALFARCDLACHDAAMGEVFPLDAAGPMDEAATARRIEIIFEAARDRRNEGIILKDADSPYSPGRRGQSWLKLKTHLPTLDCVVTAAEYGHGKRRGTLSDYTFAVWSDDPGAAGVKLVNVGKAYSGVTDEEIATLTETFLSLAIERHGSVYRVQPKIVLEIAADQIQKSDRHASGYALRFPRIKRIRWDKSPADADRLSRVAELYHSAANFGRATPASLADQAPADLPQPTLFD